MTNTSPGRSWIARAAIVLIAGALLAGVGLGLAAAATPHDATSRVASVGTGSRDWLDRDPLDVMAPGSVSRVTLPWWLSSHRSAPDITASVPDRGNLRRDLPNELKKLERFTHHLLV